MTIPIKITLNVKDFSLPYQRLDVWVTEAIKVSDKTKQQLNLINFSFSRSRIKSLIEENHLKVDGIIIDNPSFKVTNCKKIQISLPIPKEPIPLPEDIRIEIIYEDDFIIVLNKFLIIFLNP